MAAKQLAIASERRDRSRSAAAQNASANNDGIARSGGIASIADTGRTHGVPVMAMHIAARSARMAASAEPVAANAMAYTAAGRSAVTTLRMRRIAPASAAPSFIRTRSSNPSEISP